jgi:hypothetical protein
MFPVRILIVVAIAVSLTLVLEMGMGLHGWPVTFAIGVIAIGTSYLVTGRFRGAPQPTRRRAVQPKLTARQRELKILMNKAMTAEGRGQWDQARALFEQVIQKAADQEDRDLAVRRIEEIRNQQLAEEGA